VQFNIDGVNYGSPATVSGGTATLAVSNLTAGSHTVYAIYNGDGNFNGSTSSSISQMVNGSIAITSVSPLANGQVGTYYSQTLTASGGIGSYTWSITGGALPSGLLLTGNTIGGTPSTVGATIFTVQVSDASSNKATRVLSILINPAGGGSTPIIAITQNPTLYEGVSVTISGSYLGWESGHGSPPVTRSDWVLQDDSGAIYVSGSSQGLTYPMDTGRSVVVIGVVRLNNGQPYIEIPKSTSR